MYNFLFIYLDSNSVKRFWFSGLLINTCSSWFNACAVCSESQRYACTCNGHFVVGLYNNRTQATMSSVCNEHVIALCVIKCFEEPCKKMFVYEIFFCIIIIIIFIMYILFYIIFAIFGEF